MVYRCFFKFGKAYRFIFLWILTHVTFFANSIFKFIKSFDWSDFLCVIKQLTFLDHRTINQRKLLKIHRNVKQPVTTWRKCHFVSLKLVFLATWQTLRFRDSRFLGYNCLWSIFLGSKKILLHQKWSHVAQKYSSQFISLNSQNTLYVWV